MMMIHSSRLQRILLLFFGTVMTGLLFSNCVSAATNGIAIKQEDVFVLPNASQKVIHVVNNIQVTTGSSTPAQVRLSVPKNATAVQLTDGNQAVPVKQHQGTIEVPILGGKSTASVVESYNLPLTGQQDVQFTLHTDYPVYSAYVYLPIGEHASLSAQGLMTHTQTVSVKGVNFRVFTRPSIAAGADWTLSVQMLPTTTVNSQVKNLPVIGTRPDNFLNTLQAVGNLLVAALVLVVGLVSIRATQWGRAVKTPLSKEEALLQSWENIELQYEHGTLNEEDYQRRRERLKQRLAVLKSGESS